MQFYRLGFNNDSRNDGPQYTNRDSYCLPERVQAFNWLLESKVSAIGRVTIKNAEVGHVATTQSLIRLGRHDSR
jgi:hypothetical protein